MVILALDMSIIAVVVFCGWRGYKNGLIRGVFGVVTLIVSLFLANVAASAYSGEFTEMLDPFIGGVIDTALVDIMEADAEYEEFDAGEDAEVSENFITAFTALRRIGLHEAPAARVAALAMEGNEGDVIPAGFLSDLIASKLSSTLSFVFVFGIAFILIAIIFSVIGNLIGFVFSLPGLKVVDAVAGALLGLAKGLLIVFSLALIVRYLGLLASETFDGTTVLKYIINNNPLAEIIGI